MRKQNNDPVDNQTTMFPPNYNTQNKTNKATPRPCSEQVR